jgi:G:T-mismatch repair DNA endonuclease (very short patch repair protein)
MNKKVKKKGKLKKMFKKMKGTSKLEDKFAEVLDSLNINYQQYVNFKGREYDFLLTDHNILVETHGCFYHCCKTHNPEAKYSFQRANLKNDQYKVKLVKFEKDYSLMVVWEHEITDTELLNEKINKFIKKHSILLKD